MCSWIRAGTHWVHSNLECPVHGAKARYLPHPPDMVEICWKFRIGNQWWFLGPHTLETFWNIATNTSTGWRSVWFWMNFLYRSSACGRCMAATMITSWAWSTQHRGLSGVWLDKVRSFGWILLDWWLPGPELVKLGFGTFPLGPTSRCVYIGDVISTGLSDAPHRLIPPVYQGIFYADIASDIKQLLLFYQKDLWDYCLFNFLGLLIPPMVSIREALRWRERLSPDQNFFKGLIRSDVMQKLVILTAILTQTYMLILAMVSVRFRKTPGTSVYGQRLRVQSR